MKKVSKVILILSLIMAFPSAFAANKNTITAIPQLSEKSNQLSQDEIDREANKRAQPVAEALAAVDETRVATNFLGKNNSSQAKAALERSLGKLDAVLANHPDVALVPISVDIRVIDMKVEEDTLKRITNGARTLVNLGRYQAARELLKDLASELDVATVNLPVATYPNSVRKAVGLIDQGKLTEARTELLSALHSLVIVETAIPLPVIRAQAIVDEVSRQTKENKIDKAQAIRLLTEADQQLTLAEKLGYGTRRDDFKGLHSSIKELQANIRSNGESGGLLANLKNDLQSLKEKIVNKVSSSK